MGAQRRLLYHDPDFCVGCRSCEVACKQEHDLPVEVNRIRIITEGPTIVNGELKLSFKRVGCMHCPKPPCIKACPTGAIIKRPGGIVFIERSLCTGCQDCAQVCPYDAINFHTHKQWAEICDLCVHRLDEGLPPFCVQHCMGSNLFYGTKEEFQQMKKGGRENAS